MNQEHFGLIVGLATIGAFLLELAKVLYAVCKKLSSRRMARKGEKDTPIDDMREPLGEPPLLVPLV